jgi:hypothetical protein
VQVTGIPLDKIKPTDLNSATASPWQTFDPSELLRSTVITLVDFPHFTEQIVASTVVNGSIMLSSYCLKFDVGYYYYLFLNSKKSKRTKILMLSSSLKRFTGFRSGNTNLLRLRFDLVSDV